MHMLHHYRTGPLIVAVLLLSTLTGELLTWAHVHVWEHHGWTGGVSVVTVIGAFLTWHNYHLWRLPVFNLLVDVPVIRGVYHGTIRFKFNGEERSKVVRVEVKQNATSVSVCGWFSSVGDAPREDTMSRSVHADLVDRDGHGSWQLCMQYANEGERTTGSTAAHDGFAVLDLEIGTGALKGHYFTGRSTGGTLELIPSKKH